QKANDEALKIQEEREKKQLAIAVKYATPEQKLALDNAEAIKQIKLAHAGDQEAIDKYLKLQETAYQKDLDSFRATQNEKIISATEDAVRAAANWNQTYADISGNSGFYGLQQTRNSRYDESFAVFDSQSTLLDKQAEDPNADLQALADQREALWQEHTQRMLLIDQVYNRDKASM
ncbi:hypothetical protein ABTN42_20215, partial [Acinetobacter baumannii]